jgi:GNAT superfamily N-acetyltransferase
MDYFIFNFNKHLHLIPSFLKSASLSHKIPLRDKDWFLWKFRDSPYGQSVLSCVKDGDKIIGCVGYGLQPFKLNQIDITGAFAFESFVHPDYQRRGIYKNLLNNAEKAVSLLDVSFLISVPNSNSLNGFLKMSWNKLQTPSYWIRPKNIPKIIFSLRSLKMLFESNPSNLKKINFSKLNTQIYSEHLTPMLSTDYLEWRFLRYPVGEYLFNKEKNFFSIMRVGKRGKLIELQSLYLQISPFSSFKFSSLVSKLSEQLEFDLISFPISHKNKLGKLLAKNFFINVPNKTNICFKILNSKHISVDDFENISISGINYHTY